LNRFIKFTTQIKRTDGWLVTILLGWMLLVASLQLVLRWTAGIGIPWADLQLRQLVLWIGLLGGVLAAAEGRHIRIDLVEHYFSYRFRRLLSRLVSICATLGSVYLGYLSLSFISSEKGAGVNIDGLLFGASVPMWITQLIFPISFWLMGIYFFVPVVGDRNVPAPRT